MRQRMLQKVKLGGDHVIKIILVAPTTLAEISEADVALDGYWDDENETIYIDKKLSTKKRWNIYWHELRHAINDIADAEQTEVA